jgi:hypothetical protein
VKRFSSAMRTSIAEIASQTVEFVEKSGAWEA